MAAKVARRTRKKERKRMLSVDVRTFIPLSIIQS